MSENLYSFTCKSHRTWGTLRSAIAGPSCSSPWAPTCHKGACQNLYRLKKKSLSLEFFLRLHFQRNISTILFVDCYWVVFSDVLMSFTKQKWTKEIFSKLTFRITKAACVRAHRLHPILVEVTAAVDSVGHANRIFVSTTVVILHSHIIWKKVNEKTERKFHPTPSSEARERTAVLAGLGAVGKHPPGVGDAFREVALVPRLAVLVSVLARASCDQRTSISLPIENAEMVSSNQSPLVGIHTYPYQWRAATKLTDEAGVIFLWNYTFKQKCS